MDKTKISKTSTEEAKQILVNHRSILPNVKQVLQEEIAFALDQAFKEGMEFAEILSKVKYL